MRDKSRRADVNEVVDKYTLIRTFKTFRGNPLKIFVNADFHYGKKFREKYLHTLEVLGLIEEVEAVYDFGRKYKTRRSVKGYRFVNGK